MGSPAPLKKINVTDCATNNKITVTFTLQNRYMTRKTDKTCVVCGVTFKGTAGRITCKEACRTALHRIMKSGKKPDYWLIAKSKGQKMPLLFSGPKPKNPTAEPKIEKEIKFAKITEKSFSGEKAPKYVVNEIALFPSPQLLTKEQVLSQISKMEAQKVAISKEQSPVGVHPKMARFDREDRISNLDDLIKELK